MKYLKVHDWEEWQTYRSDRNQPPWIKLHRALLRDEKWTELTDAEKGQIVSMWMLAADKKGYIPADPARVRKLALLDENPDLERFIKIGLIDPQISTRDAKVTPTRRQHDAAPTPTRRARLDKTRNPPPTPPLPKKVGGLYASSLPKSTPKSKSAPTLGINCLRCNDTGIRWKGDGSNSQIPCDCPSSRDPSQPLQS